MLLCVLLTIATVAAVPSPDEKKDRVLNHDLSGQEHFSNQQHNPSYDHEAFLGDEAATFDQLTPEESRRRLGIIVNKIDKDEDGLITHDELKDWINLVQKQYIVDDVNKNWKEQNPNEDGKISWQNYKKNVYGFMDNLEAKDFEAEENGYTYDGMVKRERRRWTVADHDEDGLLTKEEFTAFLHPQEFDRMKDIIVLEALEDIDKDNDGKISLEEYIGDMYKPEDNSIEPDWVQTEKEQFATYRDTDKDGFLDMAEVRNWIVPPDFDHAEAETRHLIFEADADGDEKLTKEEIINKYDVFVGSQATDFGEIFARHDEF